MSSLMFNRRIVACFVISIFLLSTLLVPAANAVECHATGFEGYTAAFVNPTPEELPMVVNAAGCHIGIYFSEDGSVNGVEVSNANFGIVNDGATVDITGSNIHDIGDYGILFTNGGHGTIDGNIVSHYERGGIFLLGEGTEATVIGNVVTGLGPTASTVQNGIQVGYMASGYLKGNEVSGNWNTGPGFSSSGSGILGGDYFPLAHSWVGPASLIAENNNVHDNQYSIRVWGTGYPTHAHCYMTAQLTKNNVHHSNTGIAIMCEGSVDKLTIEDNNIHHNTDALITSVSASYTYYLATVNHLHQNEHEPIPPP